MYDLGLINGLVYVEGGFHELNVYVKGERIESISSDLRDAKEIYDLKGKWLLPGFIDPHVHFELTVAGRTSVDDFKTGSVSAAFGGITTFIDFIDPSRSVSEIEENFKKRLEQARKSVLDYAFHSTLADPSDSAKDIVEVSTKLGMTSIKVFTTYSSTNRRTHDDFIDDLLKISRDMGFVLTVHAENDDIIRRYEMKRPKISDHSKARPTVAELSEIIKLAQMSAFREGQLYVVHVSSGLTVEEVAKRFEKELGRYLVLETCPHYLYLDDSLYQDENANLYAMTPPLRSSEEKELLRKHFDLIHTVGTDHCSFMRSEKFSGIYTGEIPMGIGGVEFSFSLVYTLFGIKALSRFTENVAKVYGLYPEKGVILPGSYADLVVFDPNVIWTISGHHSVSDYNVYSGFEVRGKVISTISRGRFVVRNGVFIGRKGWGKYLARKKIVWE